MTLIEYTKEKVIKKSKTNIKKKKCKRKNPCYPLEGYYSVLVGKPRQPLLSSLVGAQKKIKAPAAARSTPPGRNTRSLLFLQSVQGNKPPKKISHLLLSLTRCRREYHPSSFLFSSFSIYINRWNEILLYFHSCPLRE